MAMPQFILRHSEPTMNPTSDELAHVIIHRLGLMPRKKVLQRRMALITIPSQPLNTYSLSKSR